MHENDISGIIIDCCYKIHQKMGPGLLEGVYEKILAYEFSKRQISFDCQKIVPFKYENIKVDVGFRLDFLVESKVIVELKSVEKILAIHKKQLLSYLKLTNLKLGLLINFNSVLLKDGIYRIVNNL